RDEEGTGASGVSGTGEAVLRGTGEVSSKENGRRKTGNRKPETVRSRIRTFPVSRCLFPVACFFFSVPAIARTGFGDYVKAVRAPEEQRIDDARDLVAELAKAAPDDPEVQALEAQVAFLDGDYARAAGLLDKLTDPKLKELKPLVNETIAATKGMLHKDSPHFSIFYQPGKDEVLVDLAAETLESAYATIGEDLGEKPKGKIRVEILPRVSDLARVSTLTEKEIETSGTIALCKYNKLMVVSPRATLFGYPWLDTMAHELTHYIIMRAT